LQFQNFPFLELIELRPIDLNEFESATESLTSFGWTVFAGIFRIHRVGEKHFGIFFHTMGGSQKNRAGAGLSWGRGSPLGQIYVSPHVSHESYRVRIIIFQDCPSRSVPKKMTIALPWRRARGVGYNLGYTDVFLNRDYLVVLQIVNGSSWRMVSSPFVLHFNIALDFPVSSKIFLVAPMRTQSYPN
jgi:hypothetical protein